MKKHPRQICTTVTTEMSDAYNALANKTEHSVSHHARKALQAYIDGWAKVRTTDTSMEDVPGSPTGA